MKRLEAAVGSLQKYHACFTKTLVLKCVLTDIEYFKCGIEYFKKASWPQENLFYKYEVRIPMEVYLVKGLLIH